MDRTPRDRQSGGLDFSKRPRRTYGRDRSQLFASLSNDERAHYDHDPERWWAAVRRQRKPSP